jgi:exosome complex exonuclease DIS3/RRP44
MEALFNWKTPQTLDTVRVSYKRTRRGKIRKLVRPVFFRDDIACGVVGCQNCVDKDISTQLPAIDSSKTILVVDSETAVTQTDFILQDSCVSNCVLCYTALDRVKSVNRARADKLRSLCTPASLNTDRSFYAFPNEFLQEAFVPFASVDGGSSDDRDFDAVVNTCKWYIDHLGFSEGSNSLLLLTSSEERRDKAISSGLTSMTVWEYTDSLRDKYPLAGEKLAQPGTSVIDQEFSYPAHLSADALAEGIREGRFRQGVLRMAPGTCVRGSVSDVEIVGKENLNRGIDGDVVVVELVDQTEGSTTTPSGMNDDTLIEESNAVEKDQSAAITESADLADRDFLPDLSLAQGRVVGIIRRNWKEYAGTLRSEEDASRQDRMFIPADSRIPFVRIRTRNGAELEGKRIVCVIDSWDRFSRSPNGHWVSVLGVAGDRDTESAVILREHEVITREFSSAVMQCLPPRDFTPSEEEIKKRLDLRAVPVCSIDPPGCKDIDDALSCEILPDGNYRVGVHIADVTHFVHPDSAIDKEAAERCTTVYLVEKRTDMLPALLTADLCSLREKVDRLTFSVIWKMRPNGDILETEFHKAVIRSAASLTYAAAQNRIDDTKDHSELTESIRRLNSLAKQIRTARMNRGGLELASQEVRFELDAKTQDPTEVAVYVSRDTNKLVEEFMVLANQSVGRKILENFPTTSVLRRHPPPKAELLETLKELLAKQGYTAFHFGTNKELADSLSAIIRTNDPFFNRLVRLMTTRCMNQAQYFCTGDIDPGSYWHYGLSMDVYTHFTSPIRRYADVLVHRLLAASLGLSAVPESLQTKSMIHTQCDVMNKRHKLAQMAGRASAELHIYLYFKKLGEQVTDCVVTRVRMTKKNEIALHVLSPKFGVEGVVTLPSGWIFDPTTEVASNLENSNEPIAVFDHVMVKVATDDTNFRLRTLFAFIRKSVASDFASQKPVKELPAESCQLNMIPIE